MSPEQARGEAVDRTTDLFSLGSMLYAMCTGEPPFRAETAVAVLRRVSDDVPRPIARAEPRGARMAGRNHRQADGERHLASDTSRQPELPKFWQGISPRESSQRNQPRAGQRVSVRLRRSEAVSENGRSFVNDRSGGRGHRRVVLVGFQPTDLAASRAADRLARSQATPSPPDPPPSGPLIVAKNVPRDPVMSKTFSGLAEEAAKKREQKRASSFMTNQSAAIRRTPRHCSGAPRLSSSYSIANWPGAIADTTK